MSYEVPRIKWEDPKLEGFQPAPIITITAKGVHDVGRLIECLAHGNSEQAHVARRLVDRLNRKRAGRWTLSYLQSHGGGKWFTVRKPRKGSILDD